MDAAIDRNILNQVVFNGMYLAGNQPVSPESDFTRRTIRSGADLARAKQLVANSGLSAPKLTCSSTMSRSTCGLARSSKRC